jgi:hypothetical protein
VARSQACISAAERMRIELIVRQGSGIRGG